MKRFCTGCRCSLPTGYLDCDGDNKHASEPAVAEAIAVLKKITRVDRAKALRTFCRDCSRTIEQLDWSGRNYCNECSPAPLE